MLRCKGCTFGVHRRQARGQACWGLSGRATGGRTGARERAAAGALFTLSAPHFGPPASYTRIPDQSPGYYSSPDDQWRTCEHRDMNYKRKAGCTKKAEESRQKNRQTRNPENSGAGTVALFIIESLKHRKVPNMGL
ncbi:hypothetical protein CDL15_Pgr016730 [Punica granatum]|uniref:Uncharacterized protein n=1 Tax=Punica granatum TaxID=22663 RepID=A0A218WUL0_PUNGR|nr:hypothetical protein CDL15_Pgr016730 [Punica granatum]